MSGLYRVIEGAGPYVPGSTDIWHVIEPPSPMGVDEAPHEWAQKLAATYAAMEEDGGAQEGSRIRAIIQDAAGVQIAESNVYTVGELE